MGIFPDPVPTDEEIAKQQMIELNAWADGTLQIMKERVNEMFSRFWSNPIDISAAYGVLASQLFIKLSTLQGAMQSIDPTYTPIVPDTTKWDVTLNQDGTVTIKETVNDTAGSSKPIDPSSGTSTSDASGTPSDSGSN